MFSCEIYEFFKNTYFQEHLPADASINERQQVTRTLLGKTNKSQLIMSASRKLQLHEFDSFA